MADKAVVPEKPTSLVGEYLKEVQRVENARRLKKKFRTVEGFPFWPHEVVRDAIIVCFFTAVIFFLSGFVPYYLEAPADPSGQPHIILPDWYLLWSYGLLKIAHDVTLFGFTIITAKVWGVLLNGVVLAPLIVVPFIHPGHSRRPVEDPVWASFGSAGLMLAFTLSAYSVNGVYRVAPGMGWTTSMIGTYELDAWLTMLLPVVTFFLTYVPLKWRKSIEGYENKLSRNYYRIR
jgi:quinol-cytochrome oxidoreductase complex cytochrome b subunit